LNHFYRRRLKCPASESNKFFSKVDMTGNDLLYLTIHCSYHVISFIDVFNLLMKVLIMGRSGYLKSRYLDLGAI